MEILEYPDKTLLEEIKDLVILTDDEVKGKVYIHKSPSDKLYIGITCRSYNQRFNNGKGYSRCSKFYSAIKKYGGDKIKHYYLIENISESSAKEIEAYLIQKFTELNICYNLEKGGTGSTKSQETREKISQHNLQRGEEGHKKLSNAHKKKVIQYTSEGILLREGDSALDAKKELGIDNSAIALCCNNKRVHAGGYRGKGYENKDIPFYNFEEEQEKFKRNLSLRGGKIFQFDKNGVFIKEGECLYDVLKENPSYKKPSICKNLNGNCPSKYGYIGKREKDI